MMVLRGEEQVHMDSIDWNKPIRFGVNIPFWSPNWLCVWIAIYVLGVKLRGDIEYWYCHYMDTDCLRYMLYRSNCRKRERNDEWLTTIASVQVLVNISCLGNCIIHFNHLFWYLWFSFHYIYFIGLTMLIHGRLISTPRIGHLLPHSHYVSEVIERG